MDDFESNPKGLKICLEVIPEVEERLIGSKKVKSWLIFYCKRPHVDFREYFHRAEYRLWKYSQRVEDEF